MMSAKLQLNMILLLRSLQLQMQISTANVNLSVGFSSAQKPQTPIKGQYFYAESNEQCCKGG